MYERDDAGRVVRSVSWSEPRWTPLDRAEQLALSLYRASMCPGGCGQPLDESTSHYTVGPAYDATRVTCRACAARDEAQRADAEKSKGGDAGARLWSIHRLPPEG